jgi:hypothetical protein
MPLKLRKSGSSDKLSSSIRKDLPFPEKFWKYVAR